MNLQGAWRLSSACSFVALACGSQGRASTGPDSLSVEVTLPGSQRPQGAVEVARVASDGAPVQKPLPPTVWEHDSTRAVARAQRAERPLFVVACAAWATPCARIDAQMREPAVVRALGPYIALRLDLDEDTPEINEVVSRFGIDKIPSLILLDLGSGRREDLEALAPADVVVETLGRFVTR